MESNQETPKRDATTVTIAEVDELIIQLRAKEAEINVADEVVGKIARDIFQLEQKLIGYLKDLGRDSYDGGRGADTKIKIEGKWRVGMPKDALEKRKLFEHIKERGLFDQYATIHVASLNSLYKADWNEAELRGEGMTFSMPGIAAPKYEEKLKYKKTRKKSSSYGDDDE